VSERNDYLAEGPRVGIRPFTYEDGAEFIARVRESKALHHPWLAPPASADAYASYAGRLIEDPAKAVPLARALVTGGVDIIEVTLRTPRALDAVVAIADEVPQIALEVDDVTVTLTVLDRDDERFAARARTDETPQRARLAEVERLLDATGG
jgi:hypothetical protein